MLSRFKNRNFYFILLTDLVLFCLAHFGAYALRFEFQIAGQMENFVAVLPYLLVIKAVVFCGYGLYQGMWRYTGLSDMWRLVQAVGVSSMSLGEHWGTLFIYKLSDVSCRRTKIRFDPIEWQ